MNFNQVVADVALILIGLLGNVLTPISDLFKRRIASCAKTAF
jgi:hypothetical protein